MSVGRTLFHLFSLGRSREWGPHLCHLSVLNYPGGHKLPIPQVWHCHLLIISHSEQLLFLLFCFFFKL